MLINCNYFSSRRGMVLFIAFAVIGLIGIFAAIYMFTSRHSKLQSRRIFWGELSFFLADSLVEETFAIIKHRSLDPRENGIGSLHWIRQKAATLNSEAQVFDLPIQEFSTMELLKSSFAVMGLKHGDIAVQVRTFVLASGEEAEHKFVHETEKIGTIEVVATVNLPVSQTSDAKVIRQAQGRRDFRFVSLQGYNPLHDYAFLIKKAPESEESYSLTGSPALLIEAGEGFAPGSFSESDYKFGRVFLGIADEGKSKVLQSPFLSITEQRYLQSSSDLGTFRSPNGPFENKITRYESFSTADPERSEFLLDSLLQDPNLAKVLSQQFPGIIGEGGLDDFDYVSLSDDNKNILRESMRDVLKKYYQNKSNAEIMFSFYPAVFPYPAFNISIDGCNDFPVLVEGRNYRLFGFDGEVRYEGGFLDGGVEDNRFPFYTLRNASAVYHKTTEKYWYPVFFGQDGITADNAELKMREYVAYRNLNAFSYMFTPNGDKSAWEWFKTYNMVSDTERDYIFVDGIMVIDGSIHLERDTVFSGQGVLWVVGRVQIDGAVLKSASTDSLTIVSRASYQGGGAALGITSSLEQEIQAHLQIHSIDFNRLPATMTAAQPFFIRGGLSIDNLRVNALPRGSKISYDAMLARRIDAFSLSNQYNFYKIHNNQRVELVK